jgi:hypothetical protein
MALMKQFLSAKKQDDKKILAIFCPDSLLNTKLPGYQYNSTPPLIHLPSKQENKQYPYSLNFSSPFAVPSTTTSNPEFLAIKNFKSKITPVKLD